MALARLEELAHIGLESNAPSLGRLPAGPQRADRSPLVHLVEDDPTQARSLAQTIEAEGFRVRLFADVAELERAWDEHERPAAVVIDMMFPEDDNAGAECIAGLRRRYADFSPIIFASLRGDLPARLATYRAGACSYLTKPVDTGRLCRLLNQVTGRLPTNPFRVLLVEGDPLIAEAQAAVLREAGMVAQTVVEPLKTVEAVSAFEPDVLLLDVHMPEASGAELASALREQDAYAQLPILFLSAESDMSRQWLNLGGDGFLIKPVSPEYLVAVVRSRAQRSRTNAGVMLRLKAALHEGVREHFAVNQHAIVSIADRAGNITYANDKFCEISGYSRAELLGRNHRVIKSREHPPAFYEEMWQTISGGNVWQGEICNLRRDGRRYWVASTITPFLEAKGTPCQYVSIRTDITAQKHTEEELRKSEARLAQILASANDAIIMADSAGKITLWNAMAERMFGYRADEVIGGDLHRMIIPERYHAALGKGFAQFRRSGEGKGIGRSRELAAQRKDGSEFPVEVSLSAIRLEGGWHAIGMVRDISKRKRVEAELLSAKEAAERANRSKSEFLSMMSHELRTPMNAVLGFAQLMAMDRNVAGDQQENVQEIIKAGSHLLGLINEILDLARMEAGRIDLSLDAVAVADAVDDCRHLIAPLAAERGITLHVDIEAAAKVRADRARLRQVLLNLLSNAVKYNRRGGRIDVVIHPASAERLRISVADSGDGISEERLGELFEPFCRLGAEYRGIEGTGIGLTITRHLVDLMGGEIGVASTPGSGSTFWIELPVVAPERYLADRSPGAASGTR